MEAILSFVTSAIYLGFCLTMVLLLVFRKKIGEPTFKMLVISNSYLVLARAIVLCASLLFDLFSDWFDASSYDKYVLANRATGTYSFLFWLSIGASYLLPFLFLIKKQGVTMLSSYVLLAIWLSAYLAFLTYLSTAANSKYETSILQVLEKLAFHSALLSLTCLIFRKRHKTEFAVLERSLY